MLFPCSFSGFLYFSVSVWFPFFKLWRDTVSLHCLMFLWLFIFSCHFWGFLKPNLNPKCMICSPKFWRKRIYQRYVWFWYSSAHRILSFITWKAHDQKHNLYWFFFLFISECEKISTSTWYLVTNFSYDKRKDQVWTGFVILSNKNKML